MAYVRLKYTSAQGDQLAVTMDIESSYPDAVAEARAQAVTALREAAALFWATSTTDDE